MVVGVMTIAFIMIVVIAFIVVVVIAFIVVVVIALITDYCVIQSFAISNLIAR